MYPFDRTALQYINSYRKKGYMTKPGDENACETLAQQQCAVVKKPASRIDAESGEGFVVKNGICSDQKALHAR